MNVKPSRFSPPRLHAFTGQHQGLARALRIPLCSLALLIQFCAFAAHPDLELSRRVHTRLQTVQADVAAGDLQRALSRARSLLESIDSARYDRAMVLQALAHIHIARGSLKAAVTSARKALALGVLEAKRELVLEHRLYRGLIALERYREGVKHYKRWIRRGGKANQGDLLAVSQAYLALREFGPAARLLEILIKRSSKPKPAWLQALSSAYYEQGKVNKTIGVFKRLLAMQPADEGHWRSLAALYEEVDADNKATMVLASAYRNGTLVSAADVTRLAARYRYAGAPFKAGLLLEDAFAKNYLVRDEQPLRWLADSWLEAREYHRARAALESILSLRVSSQVLWDLGRIAATQREWVDSADYLVRAIEKSDDLEQASRAWYLLGTVRVHFDRSAAAAAFRVAQGYDVTRRGAAQWLEYLSSLDGVVEEQRT